MMEVWLGFSAVIVVVPVGGVFSSRMIRCGPKYRRKGISKTLASTVCRHVEHSVVARII